MEIFSKLKPKDLLLASEVCKYWRDVLSPVIAKSFYLKFYFLDQAKRILSKTSVRYKHFSFVSFLLLKCKLIYI